jgi:SAM-dependent methyltransferase
MHSPTQDLSNKIGEVRFRRKLYEQQVEGERIFEDEFDATSIEAILRERMEETRRTLARLQEDGVVLEPFLEIGAERGQRSLVLENDLDRRGAALDLSLDLLRSCTHYAERFDRPRLPLRVCADAYRLPFRTGSLPFVFCYQTLHHFPALEPIVAEVHRVLAPGGRFFFAEEPYRRVARVPLLRAKGGVGKAPRSRFRKLLRNVFVEERFNEEEFGVLENHDMALSQWKAAMAIFAEGSATLELDRFRVSATGRRNPFLYLALWLLGGRISGVYRKAGRLTDYAATVQEALIDPATIGAGAEGPLRGLARGVHVRHGRVLPRGGGDRHPHGRGDAAEPLPRPVAKREGGRSASPFRLARRPRFRPNSPPLPARSPGPARRRPSAGSPRPGGRG